MGEQVGDSVRRRYIVRNHLGMVDPTAILAIAGPAYRLARPPAAIRLDEVADAVEPALGHDATARSAAADATRNLAQALRQRTQAVLALYSLADFLERSALGQARGPQGQVRCAAPPWARWIPLERLPFYLDRCPADGRIVTVRDRGARSLGAAALLREWGRGGARALTGGLAAWQRMAR
jgi:rhodanese-related sulfurtransferase